MARSFTWDPAKADSNFKKHGVAFELATRIFADRNHLSELESHINGEERWHTIGYTDGSMFVVVIHTDWEEENDEIIRIISARPATPRERAKYEQGKYGSIRH